MATSSMSKRDGMAERERGEEERGRRRGWGRGGYLRQRLSQPWQAVVDGDDLDVEEPGGAGKGRGREEWRREGRGGGGFSESMCMCECARECI
jgi:hypothetical protein